MSEKGEATSPAPGERKAELGGHAAVKATVEAAVRGATEELSHTRTRVPITGTAGPDRAPAVVSEANVLLEFAAQAGKAVPAAVALDITGATSVTPSFLSAYRELAALMGGVSFRTLRATDDDPAYARRPWPEVLFRTPVSEARRWSLRLWLVTLATAVFIVVDNNYHAVLMAFFARDEQSAGVQLYWYGLDIVLQSLLPFAYGTMGACAYLLRSAHDHIHERTFDPIRIPEYYNRLLLGTIAGGSVELLVDALTTDGAVVSLSGAALAFVAGYNADLLFRVIERVSGALLPKAEGESSKKQEVPTTPRASTGLDGAHRDSGKGS